MGSGLICTGNDITVGNNKHYVQHNEAFALMPNRKQDQHNNTRKNPYRTTFLTEGTTQHSNNNNV